MAQTHRIGGKYQLQKHSEIGAASGVKARGEMEAKSVSRHISVSAPNTAKPSNEHLVSAAPVKLIERLKLARRRMHFDNVTYARHRSATKIKFLKSFC